MFIYSIATWRCIPLQVCLPPIEPAKKSSAISYENQVLFNISMSVLEISDQCNICFLSTLNIRVPVTCIICSVNQRLVYPQRIGKLATDQQTGEQCDFFDILKFPGINNVQYVESF